MKAFWTTAGDETSWPEWVQQMCATPASDTARQLVTSLLPGSQHWALDIGCGTGRSFQLLVDRGYQVVGVDPVPQAALASKTTAQHAGLPAWAVQATASRLPLRTGSIKAILAIGVLYHLGPTEMDAALSEIYRVLYSGGEAFLHFLDIDDWRQELGEPVMNGFFPLPGYRAVVTYFANGDTLHQMISLAGLVIQSSVLKVQTDDQGERRDWFLHCSRP
jgi:ubiquinone/menaquinone biosynthesis C-methylase UbiE